MSWPQHNINNCASSLNVPGESKKQVEPNPRSLINFVGGNLGQSAGPLQYRKCVHINTSWTHTHTHDLDWGLESARLSYAALSAQVPRRDYYYYWISLLPTTMQHCLSVTSPSCGSLLSFLSFLSSFTIHTVPIKGFINFSAVRTS